MSNSPDARRARLADDDWTDEATRISSDAPSGSAAVVCVCTAGSPNAFCTVTPQAVTGAETSGSSGEFDEDGGSFQALNLGSGDPTGQNVLCVYTPYRWVFFWE